MAGADAEGTAGGGARRMDPGRRDPLGGGAVAARAADAPLLSVAGLAHSYGARIGCAGIGFDLWPGEVMGIVGESGSGKTTLLRLLAGELRPDAGRIRYRRAGDADPAASVGVAGPGVVGPSARHQVAGQSDDGGPRGAAHRHETDKTGTGPEGAGPDGAGIDGAGPVGAGPDGTGTSGVDNAASGAGDPRMGLRAAGTLGADMGGAGVESAATDWIELGADAGPDLRRHARRDWAHVHQNPRDGLRMDVTAGGNLGEPLMARGLRHYGRIRARARDWLERVEIAADRIDDLPRDFSGGMQQRLQIARSLITAPRLVLMDEPTGGLDVSVQARLLDLLRGLVREMGLSAVIVTHDLAVARLLADRLMVMKDGRVVEAGLTDQVLDDPQHPYTQLLVASVLQV